jgi:hypothetical protein
MKIFCNGIITIKNLYLWSLILNEFKYENIIKETVWQKNGKKRVWGISLGPN